MSRRPRTASRRSDLKKKPQCQHERKHAPASGGDSPDHSPRGAAWSILNRLDEENQSLDGVLDTFFGTAQPSDRRNVNLVHALVFGVQRRRATLDYVIARLSKTPLHKLDPAVLNVLRIGLFQILYMDRIPDAAAVNTAVEITHTFAPRWISGFVNGLLRAAVRSRGSIPFPDIQTDPVRALAVGRAFPEWLIRRWLNRWGMDETTRLCDAVNEIPPITLRANILRTNREELLKALAAEVDRAVITPFSSDGIIISGLKTPIHELSAFRQGLFQVQDEAAQLISRFFGPQSGETVMDACAGLGGKTGHLAGLMENRGRIVAVDIHARKLESLAREMRRLGITIAASVRYDLNQALPPDPNALFGGIPSFDRILLDAPCSGLGVLRRNPDAKWSAAKQNLAAYQQRQVRFLSRLAPWVRPSGILGYAVCSMEPEENEGAVAAFLDQHPEFSVHKDFSHLSADMRSLITPEGYLRTFPHRDAMDGFFSVCFIRKT